MGRTGADGLSFLDGCGAKGLSFLVGMGADGLSFLDGFCSFEIISTKSHAKLPN